MVVPPVKVLAPVRTKVAVPAVAKPRRLVPAPSRSTPPNTLVAAPPTVSTESAAEPPLRTVAVASPVRPPTVTLRSDRERMALPAAPNATTEEFAPSAKAWPTMISPPSRLTPPVKEFAVAIVTVPAARLIRLVVPAIPLEPCRR